MFSVGDTTIAIDPATEFEEGSCAELQPGVWVEAEGTLTSDGEVAASEIEVEVESADDNDDGEEEDDDETRQRREATEPCVGDRAQPSVASSSCSTFCP